MYTITAVVEKDGDWFIAYCAEVDGANGQGRTQDEALESLYESVKLILEYKKEALLKSLPEYAVKREVVLP